MGMTYFTICPICHEEYTCANRHVCHKNSEQQVNDHSVSRQESKQGEAGVNKSKIRFECPGCEIKYAANPDLTGKKGNCKKCGHVNYRS